MRHKQAVKGTFNSELRQTTRKSIRLLVKENTALKKQINYLTSDTYIDAVLNAYSHITSNLPITYTRKQTIALIKDILYNNE